MKYLMNAVAPVVIGAVLFLGPGSALAQRHIPRTDEQIKGQVEHKLSEMDVYPENVQVAVQDVALSRSKARWRAPGPGNTPSTKPWR